MLGLLVPFAGCQGPFAGSQGDGPASGPCEPPGRPTGRIDSVGLMADVGYLAADERRGRYPGSPESREVQEYLIGRLESLGAVPGPGGEWRHPFPLQLAGQAIVGTNIVAAVPGRASDAPWIVIGAHYDHLGVVEGQVMNGADDNASGVAAVLAIVAKVSAEPLHHSLLVVFFDAEEQQLSGARHFVAEPPLALDSIRLVVNLDMVSRADGGPLWASGSRHHPWLRAPLEAVAAGAPVCLVLGHDGGGGLRDWTFEGDHQHFHRAGIPFAYFGVEDHADYHRPTDDPERIDVAWYAAAVETIERALRALDAELTGGAG